MATRKHGRHLPTPATIFAPSAVKRCSNIFFGSPPALKMGSISSSINVATGKCSLRSRRAKPARPPSLYEHIFPWFCTCVFLGIWKPTPVTCKIRQGPLMRKRVHEVVSLNKKNRLLYHHSGLMECYNAAHKTASKQDLYKMDIVFRRLLHSIVGPPGEMDWTLPWHEIFHHWNEQAKVFTARHGWKTLPVTILDIC